MRKNIALKVISTQKSCNSRKILQIRNPGRRFLAFGGAETDVYVPFFVSQTQTERQRQTEQVINI